MKIYRTISSIKLKGALGILIVILVVAGAIALILKHNTPKLKPTTPRISYASTTGITGPVSFTQTVYNTYLKDWNKGERSFITQHQSWFTQNFLNNSIDFSSANTKASPDYNTASSSFLFCSKLTQKPDTFNVTAAGVLGSKAQTAKVYVNGAYRTSVEVNNLPVTLKAVNGKWAIDTRSCQLT